MALTVPQLAVAIRAHVDASQPVEEPVSGILTRLLSVATTLIEKRTENAPADVKDEATILLCGYWYDQPTTPHGDRYMAAWRYSGAASLLAPWTKRRTGITETA